MELGFYPSFMDPLREFYLDPISRILYPDHVVGENGFGHLDSQRAFVVSYKVNKNGDDTDNTGLSLHYDNAEVTINVSLTENYAGGELFFGGLWKVPLCSKRC